MPLHKKRACWIIEPITRQDPQKLMNLKPRKGKPQCKITWLVSSNSGIENIALLTLSPELLSLSWVMDYFENIMEALDSFENALMCTLAIFLK